MGTANDTVYGLASYIQTKDMNKAREIAARMRTAKAYINYPTRDAGLPFGGYNAEYGLEDFLEIKGIAGYEAAE
ncbi:aldehyde dehydrogenase family protein [Mesorhizobium caraganae]|uniref:aldehyde dehydrogenase family protein n=1 Tax=Mesorhizobium caraganae TaxID=483206 RepID=UPI003ED05946